MFIRSLKCVVLPLVFVNVITSVVDMMTVGKAGSIGWKTIGLYLFTTVIACVLGIISSLTMKPLYKEKEFTTVGPAFFQFQCDAEGSYISEDAATGALSCMPGTTDMDSSMFIVNDMSSTFVKQSAEVMSDIGLSQTVCGDILMDHETLFSPTTNRNH
jgi:Sodium:dicarboxylate symporter family